jgi:hypothetical protein
MKARVAQMRAMMIHAARAQWAIYDRQLCAEHPLQAIDKYSEEGARYWGWPNANDFGCGLQKLGKEPLSPPR